MALLSPPLDVIKRQKVQPTEGEWSLINFLCDTLDNTYEIFFQPYVNGDNPDLVIMRKGSGVLIIEVKDWNLDHYFLDEKTKWRLLKDSTLIKSPLTQVDSYKSNFFNLHLEELHAKSIKSKNMWATVNCAVYFHNSKESNLANFLLAGFNDDKYKKYQNFVKYFALLGKDSLTKEKLGLILTKFWLNKPSYYFDDTLYDSFKRYLQPPIHQIEEGIRIIYSKEQQELIRSEVRPRRKIKGVAGSGKTLVLAKRAVNAHKRTQGKVLILTYNLSLKNYIHDRISDVREQFNWTNFYITNYHQFFKTQANNYNLEINSLTAWQDISFFDSVEQYIIKFDVILIDEIQDYLQPWIDIITNYFSHSETEFVVFGDEKQNIYERELDENNEPTVRTISGAWNKSLNLSYRFGSNIGNLAIKFQKEIFKEKYGNDEIKLMSQIDFEKRIIEYHYFNATSNEALLNEIYKVLVKNQIHSSDSCVLSSKVEILRALDFSIRKTKHEKTMTTFETQEEFEDCDGNEDKIDAIRRLRKNLFYMKTGTIKLSSVHSFKGWEINTLFLFIEDDGEGNEFKNAELIYTGLTRPRKNLIIFNIGNKKYHSFFNSQVDLKFEHN